MFLRVLFANQLILLDANLPNAVQRHLWILLNGLQDFGGDLLLRYCKLFGLIDEYVALGAYS